MVEVLPYVGTINEFAELFRYSKNSVYKWVKNGKLTAELHEGKYHILRDGKYSDFISDHFEKQRKIKVKAYYPDELKDYSEWHQTLDYFSWLFKVSYSTSEQIKKKNFNLHHIFENYLRFHKIKTKSIRHHFFSQNIDKKLITDDLKRGWYNELSFIYPLKKATLGLSFREITRNLEISNTRFLFPSWKITECYYSVYFYCRSIALYKNTTFRLQEHKATLKAFKNNALVSLKKTIWKFPLDIDYIPQTKFYASKSPLLDLKHIGFNYSRHPRIPNLFPMEILKEIHSTFRKQGRSLNKPSHYTLFDFLLEFRIWGNYLDIDSLLSFYGSGFKGYLDQNLSLLLFFIAGISEVIYISVFGEVDYLLELQKIYKSFASENKEIKETFINSSLYQRMKIYKILGFISNEIHIISEINENEINSLKVGEKLK